MLIVDQCIVPFLLDKSNLKQQFNNEIINGYLDTIVFIGKRFNGTMYEKGFSKTVNII